ncbi:MAG TPA: DUF2461 domain-containing protein [Acidimicrobiia bacterium]|nr:DUF2461 domain-containing protein [Acidimicrobiia bacterium]
MPTYFTPASFKFLRELAANNERDWFAANKERYIDLVQEPALAFISDFAPRLRKISSHFEADPRVQGGSLLRPYRDIRFSKDKTPYKTNVGIRFFHEAGSDIHAPGFYLHLEPANSYAGVGLWRPEAPVARQIRQAIVDDPAGWKRAAHGKAFLSRYSLDGESLQKAPQGFDPAHPLVEDLKRKDFIAGARLPDRMVTSDTFLTEYAALAKASVPYMRFLTEAMSLAF